MSNQPKRIPHGKKPPGQVSGVKRSKSKRNANNGEKGQFLKAYFPNLISSKDPLKARGSDVNAQKKKLFGGSKSHHGGSSVSRDVTLLPTGSVLPDPLTKKASAMDNMIYDSQTGADGLKYVAKNDFEQEFDTAQTNYRQQQENRYSHYRKNAGNQGNSTKSANQHREMSNIAQIAHNYIIGDTKVPRNRRNSLSGNKDENPKLPPIFSGARKTNSKQHMANNPSGRSPGTSPRSRKSDLMLQKKQSVDQN